MKKGGGFKKGKHLCVWTQINKGYRLHVWLNSDQIAPWEEPCPDIYFAAPSIKEASHKFTVWLSNQEICNGGDRSTVTE